MRRLVADVMLAKLARWLRLSGNAISDVKSSDDKEIIRYVKRRKAVLLTKDEGLAARSKKNNFKVLLVEGNSIGEQLAFVAKKLKLRIKAEPAMICPVCNLKLYRTEKSKVRKKLPKKSSVLYNEFYICKKCGRVYWKGTHWQDIKKRLEKAKRLLRRSGSPR